MSKNGVSYAFIGDYSCIIALLGSIKYTTVATDFEKFIDTLIDKKELTNITIDMRNCTYIDSTDLGILARISIAQKQKGADKPVILYKEGSDTFSVLNDVGFGRVFTLTNTEKLNSLDFKELDSSGKTTELELAKMMVSAHEELINLDDNNSAKFEAVVKFMKDSVEKLENNS